MNIVPFTLTQLMDMRQQWIMDNEPILIAKHRDLVYEGVIDALVIQGTMTYIHQIPSEFNQFPNPKRLIESLIQQVQVLFPDLEIKYLNIRGVHDCGNIRVSVR